MLTPMLTFGSTAYRSRHFVRFWRANFILIVCDFVMKQLVDPKIREESHTGTGLSSCEVIVLTATPLCRPVWMFDSTTTTVIVFCHWQQLFEVSAAFFNTVPGMLSMILLS